MPFSEALTQQHGFLHAGAITTILDSASGYAALSLMPPDSAVLSVEFKVNILRPAQGDRFVAVSNVVKAGKTLFVTSADAFGILRGERTLIATMNGTMMCMMDRPRNQPKIGLMAPICTMSWHQDRA